MGRVAMLHRIGPAILYMRCKIGLIPDTMFPKPALPNPGLSFAGLAVSNCAPLANSFGEQSFELRPSRRKIEVVRRQGPHSVQVIWQNDERITEKWPMLLHAHISRPQRINLINQ